MAGILGRKLGMTQLFMEDGERVSATVIQAGPCWVTAVREPERDGYRAIQLAFGETKERRLQKARLGHLKKAGAPPVKHLAEFRLGDAEEGEIKIGEQVTVDAFEKGERVKVSGRSKGKGFQGTIRRHNFHRGPVSHGSHNVRAPGSIGASATPSRVLKGIRMPGHMGDQRVTQLGLEVLEVDPSRNLLIVRGSIPGPSGALVEVRSA
jgi:large subunit ribosomal protein L3